MLWPDRDTNSPMPDRRQAPRTQRLNPDDNAVVAIDMIDAGNTVAI
jgi:hypothetical protein